MLRVDGLRRTFGGLVALDRVDLHVREGEVFALIGPNGSGKTTAINVITGLFPPTSGRIYFRGRDITGLPIHERIRLGIGRTFQNIRLFKHLEVWQNVWVAHHRRVSSGEIEAALRFCDLWEQRHQLAGQLSFGEQRRLELARLLATGAELLLLDEPGAGMSPAEVEELGQRILELKARGKTILLVDHVMDLVMQVADRIAVLNFGTKIAEGTPREIQDHPAVQQAYLGTEATVGQEDRAYA